MDFALPTDRFEFALLIELPNGQFCRFLSGTLANSAIQGFALALDRLREYIPDLRLAVNGQLINELVITSEYAMARSGGGIEEAN